MTIAMAVPDELVEEAARRAAVIVAAHTPRTEERSRWVDKRGAAEFLGFSVSKIEKLTTRNQIPHHHHGGRVHYRTDELDRWLTEQ